MWLLVWLSCVLSLNLQCPWQRRLLDIVSVSKSVRENSIMRSGLQMQTLFFIVTRLGKWLKANFRVIVMTQNSLLASIIQEILSTSSFQFWVSPLAHEAFAYSIRISCMELN